MTGATGSPTATSTGTRQPPGLAELAASPDATPGPQLVTRERIAITEMPDGSWVIRRAAPLCDSCAGCGCGEQLPAFTVPALLVSMMRAHGEGKRPGLGQLRKLAAMAVGGLAGDPGEGDTSD